MWSLDESLAQLDPLGNEIGSYSGTVGVDFDSTTTGLEIEADGAWTVEIKPADQARRFDAEVSGEGDDVVIHEGDARVVALAHQGDANFAIWFYGETVDLLVNEIGPYDATVPLHDGPAILEITASGPWSITPT